jgi:hypothetical protein
MIIPPDLTLLLYTLDPISLAHTTNPLVPPPPPHTHNEKGIQLLFIPSACRVAAESGAVCKGAARRPSLPRGPHPMLQ